MHILFDNNALILRGEIYVDMAAAKIGVVWIAVIKETYNRQCLLTSGVKL